VSQDWPRVLSRSKFRSIFSKFLQLFIASFTVQSHSTFLMTSDPFYVSHFRNDWVDVWCCNSTSFSSAGCPLLRDLYCCRSMYLNETYCCKSMYLSETFCYKSMYLNETFKQMFWYPSYNLLLIHWRCKDLWWWPVIHYKIMSDAILS
jgi:hypothetical protein